MPEASPRLRLPFILPGQAQKELFHNEALVLVDAALHCSVEGAPAANPPADPSVGQCWLVAAGAGGAWIGKDGSLAIWSAGGWRFIEPFVGLSAWDKAGGYFVRWTGQQWSEGDLAVASLSVQGKKVVGTRQPAVPSPSGGTIIDEEARAALVAVIATLKSHGLTD
jgi:hypothetical protein